MILILLPLYSSRSIASVDASVGGSVGLSVVGCSVVGIIVVISTVFGGEDLTVVDDGVVVTMLFDVLFWQLVKYIVETKRKSKEKRAFFTVTPHRDFYVIT